MLSFRSRRVAHRRGTACSTAASHDAGQASRTRSYAERARSGASPSADPRAAHRARVANEQELGRRIGAGDLAARAGFRRMARSLHRRARRGRPRGDRRRCFGIGGSERDGCASPSRSRFVPAPERGPRSGLPLVVPRADLDRREVLVHADPGDEAKRARRRPRTRAKRDRARPPTACGRSDRRPARLRAAPRRPTSGGRRRSMPALGHGVDVDRDLADAGRARLRIERQGGRPKAATFIGRSFGGNGPGPRTLAGSAARRDRAAPARSHAAHGHPADRADDGGFAPQPVRARSAGCAPSRRRGARRARGARWRRAPERTGPRACSGTLASRSLDGRRRSSSAERRIDAVGERGSTT